MKEIREIKMVEQVNVKFVANDGKEFVGENAEKECATYERRMNEAQVKKAFERLGGTKIPMPFVNFFTDDAEFWEITLNSKKDYLAMTDFFEVVYNCCESYMKEPEAYPYTMTVVVGYDWYDEYTQNLKKDLQKALEQLS